MGYANHTTASPRAFGRMASAAASSCAVVMTNGANGYPLAMEVMRAISAWMSIRPSSGRAKVAPGVFD